MALNAMNRRNFISMTAASVASLAAGIGLKALPSKSGVRAMRIVPLTYADVSCKPTIYHWIRPGDIVSLPEGFSVVTNDGRLATSGFVELIDDIKLPPVISGNDCGRTKWYYDGKRVERS